MKKFIFPCERSFIKNRKVSDRMYSYFLMKSNSIADTVTVKTNGISELSRNLHISRAACKSKMERLEDFNYIIYHNKNEYIISNKLKCYIKIDEKTLKTLFKTEIDDIIKVYAYLKLLAYCYKDSHSFTYRDIILNTGYSESREMRVYTKFKNIISKLEELGLLKITDNKSYRMFYKIK